MFEKESVRATMMSIASVVFNVGMILLTSLAGALGVISWNLAWAVYLIALIPFVLCAILMTPKNVPAVKNEDEKGEKVKIKLPVPGWVLLVIFLGTIIMSQSLFNLGGVSIGAVINNPAVIGTVFSLFSVGAIAAAVLFGPAYKFLKAYVIPVFWIVGIIGYALWYVAHVTANPVLFYVAIILAGFGTNTMTVGVPMLLSTFVAPAIVGAVMGFSYVFQNGGGFLASPLDQLVTVIFGADAIVSSVWIFNIILGIILLLVMFWVAKRAKAMSEKEAPAIEE